MLLVCRNEVALLADWYLVKMYIVRLVAKRNTDCSDDQLFRPGLV